MIVVVGVSHQAAPLHVREQLALSKQAQTAFVKQLVQTGPVKEAMLLSTCNRVEIIAAADGTTPELLTNVAAVASRALVARAPEATEYVYQHLAGQAVRHLFRVAASLDSMVLGEPQILGQLKQAFDAACKAGTVGSALHRAVPRALRAAKRVRTETQIGSGQVSVPSVAVDLALQIFGELAGKTALLIGSGDMGQTVARLLRAQGAALLVLGRNPSAVQKLAAEVGGEPRSFSDLKASLTEADVVVTSTSAQNHVVDAGQVSAVRRARRGRSLCFIDLAVPRDIEPAVNKIDGVFLFNVDDLSKVVGESLESRRRERDAAEAIIKTAADGYERWVEGEQVTPVIKALRVHFSRVMQGELERSLRGRLKGLGAAEQEALRRMLEASLNKMLHEPSRALRALASEGSRSNEVSVDAAVELLETLFSLSISEAELVSDAEPSPEHASRPLAESSPGPESGPHPTTATQEDAASSGSQ